MIINKQESEVFGSNIEKTAFNIKANSKAFQILSNNLYSNKIRAIIREYSCNALDAHRYANCEDKPFKVQLPTELDQQFIVRDYGKGLSPEEIKELFTTYFSSSKDNSNDYTGALGLGSKSAFSYTESFSCKSYYNGTCYVYSLFLDNGEPNVSLMYSEKSNEPSGVEIIIPVKSEDCETFEMEADVVYSAFDVKPIGFKLKYADEMLEIIPGVYQMDFKYGKNMDSHFVARMGNVFYPIQSNSISPEYIYKLKQRLKLFSSYTSSFVIDFEIGELDIAPSREQLSYDTQTIKAIDEKMKSLSGIDILTFVLNKKENQDELKKAKSWIEFCDVIYKIIYAYTKSSGNFLEYTTLIEYVTNLDKTINGLTFKEYKNLEDTHFSKIYNNLPNINSVIPEIKAYTINHKFDSKYHYESLTIHNAKIPHNKIREHMRKLFPGCHYKTNCIIVLKDTSGWDGIKSCFKSYLDEAYKNFNYVTVLEGTTSELKEIRKYLNEKYKNTDITILDYYKIVDDIKKFKKENSVKRTVAKSTKPILDAIWTINQNAEDFSKENFSSIGFTDATQFRRFLNKNSNARFVKRCTSKNASLLFGKDDFIRVFTIEQFNDIIKENPDIDFYFVSNDHFRWNYIISENGQWANKSIAEDKSIIKKDISELVDVFLSLGIFKSDICYKDTYIFRNEIYNLGKHLDVDKNIRNKILEKIKEYMVFRGYIKKSCDIKNIFDDYNITNDYVYNTYKEFPFVELFCSSEPNKINNVLIKRFNELLSKIPELKYIQTCLGNYDNNTNQQYRVFLGLSVNYYNSYHKIALERFDNLLSKYKDLLNSKED